MADAEDDPTVRVRPPRRPPTQTRRPLALPLAGIGVAGLAIATGTYLALDHRNAPVTSAATVQGVVQAPAQASPAPPSAVLTAIPAPPSAVLTATAPVAGPPPAASTQSTAASSQTPPPELALAMADAPPPPAPTMLSPLMAADEATIREHRATTTTVFRFLANPRILVVDYPNLHEQARALNRIAAYVEKAGLPRDRLVTDGELAEYERSTQQDDDGFYYGHDYRIADMRRFFALADAEHMPLHPEELQIRQLIETAMPRDQRDNAALISIPSPDTRVDPGMRAVILHHELSHGEYFSVPAYADYVRRFWSRELTDPERAGFTRFLASEGYDSSNEDLMMNEMQAYLMHTEDRRFFQGIAAGLSTRRTAELQALFYTGMPPGWLRDCTTLGKPRAP